MKDEGCVMKDEGFKILGVCFLTDRQTDRHLWM